MGGDAKLSTVVVVVAVGCDDGEQLHLKSDARMIKTPTQTDRKLFKRLTSRSVTFLVDAGTENLMGWYLLL